MEIKHYGNILVENLKEIINYNINIIDTSGIIVASTDSQRVGDFHLIGKECVEKNQIIKVSKRENSGIYGVKEGINLPFYHNRQTIGAVGITGPIDEVSKVGLVVKKMVEIMLDEQESLLNAYVNRQEIDELFEDIILKFNSKSLFVYNQKAKKHGCSLAGCRLLVAKAAADTDFEPFFNKAAETLAQYFISAPHADSHSAVLVLSDHAPADMLDFLLKEFALKGVLSESISEISEYSMKFSRLNRLIKFIEQDDVYLYMESDYTLKLLLQNIDSYEKECFVRGYTEGLKQMDQALVNTFKTYVRNNMSISQTAAAMNLHKNTILQRIAKIRNIFPKAENHLEAFKLYCAIEFLDI